MSYPESVEYLYALGNELKAGAKFGLDRMRALLDGLGNPERNLNIIHVAGTNGKGSTCAMIAAACRAARLRTGLFTSPHLVKPTERIAFDNEPVSEDRFAELFEMVHRKAEQLAGEGKIDDHPTYFETVTAMALIAFCDNTDVVVLEVGLGGRLDATNVVMPRLTVITPIHYDHEAFLGNTIASIASEKAGILKPGIPLVMAAQMPEAEQTILKRAEELNCPVMKATDHDIEAVDLTPYGSTFHFLGNNFSCNLPGGHQVQNAATAILACREFGLPMEAIHKGVASARWPGRMEYVSCRPDFILDGAHNPAGAQSLASYIQQFCSNRPVWLVYGAMRDKAIEEVTAQLFPLASKLILTAPNFPRALRPEAILEITDHPNAITAADVPAAIELARQAPPDAAVFFTGSLFLVGEARAILVPPAA
ncbi:MAG TPA: folylpolyglutamate synthase/dihydrofolate synthase family protein [Bryobacteraceae bacterium]|nr:folylpolyglutamate synthase/dihydrofolate synthase family protein [Bryobacteraceae bacterium]